MKQLLFFILFFTHIYIKAQNINGKWNGNFEKKVVATQPENVLFDFNITNDSIITGTTHLKYKNNKYEHYAIIGKSSKNDSIIEFKEIATLGLKIGAMEMNCKGNYKLKRVRKDSIIRYEGIWKDNNKALFSCPSSKVFLERKNTNYKPIQNNNTRRDSVQHLFEMDKLQLDTIILMVYDDAIADGDVISIYLNDLLLISNYTLLAKPLLLKLFLDPTKLINKLKIVSISEGAIKPCTAFLKINTKNNEYKIFIRSNEIINGVVEFFLQ